MKTGTFPENFYWGAATASYQVEGGIENNDWAEAAREGRVPKAGKLADHYRLYPKDFALAKELGHNAHRFSVEWARIEPEEGIFDEEEIQHYRQVLTALREQGIEPFVTLWHFTLPDWFAASGGFERKDAPEIFARYCQKVVSEMGDLATHYATMNEPNVYATHGYLYGAWPPFKRVRIFWKKIGKEDGTSERARARARFMYLFQYFAVAKQLTKAHKAAFAAIKSVRPQVKVSVVKHVHVFEAGKNPLKLLLARLMQYLQTHKFLKSINDYQDEIGLNYYRYTQYGEIHNYIKTDMEWNAKPSALYLALKILSQYQKPIYVAEAGLADHDDDLRADYIRIQVYSMYRALEEGVPVVGHFYWSLMDNYEWALGTPKRFGLIEIDYDTLHRKVRPSAYVYKDIIRNRGLV